MAMPVTLPWKAALSEKPWRVMMMPRGSGKRSGSGKETHVLRGALGGLHRQLDGAFAQAFLDGNGFRQVDGRQVVVNLVVRGVAGDG